MKGRKTICCIAMIGAMFFVAQCLNEYEVIFPEILALTIGGWLAPKQPWKVNKSRLVGIMTIASIVGICIVRYCPDFFILKIGIGFAITGALLIISRTTMVPAISACILPIMLHTETIVYPVSVFVMAMIIASVQWILEYTGLRERQIYIPVEKTMSEQYYLWSKLLLLYLLIALVPWKSSNLYMIAPPLIVAFIELSNKESKARTQPVKLVGMFFLSAMIGMGIRLLLVENIHLPITIGAMIGTTILLVIMNKLQFYFPPVGATMLLPFILPRVNIEYYPIQILIGIIIFTVTAIWCFGDVSREEEKKPIYTIYGK